MDNYKITKKTKQEPFIMVYNYMLESNLLTDNEFKLYLILLKYADSNNQCFPSIKALSKQMGKVKSQVQKLLKGLQDKGVLLVENRKTESGDYTSNLYTIFDYKELFIPKSKEGNADKTNQSINLQSPQNFEIYKNDSTTILSKSQYCSREYLNDLFEFEILKSNRPDQAELFNSMIEIIYEVLNSTSEKIRVNKENKSIEVVKSRFLKLQYPHLEYVAEEVSKQTELIKNKRAYLITSLFNSYTTIDIHYTNKVKHDMSE